MAYATFQEHVDIRGSDNVIGGFDGSAVLKQALVEDANESASNDIDSAGAAGGYVVPFVPADLVAGLPVADQPVIEERITKWLKTKTVVIAAAYYLQPLGTTEQIKDARDWCDAALDRLRQGQGFPVAPPNRAGTSIHLISQPGASSQLTQQNLQAIRRVCL
jgi:hypothetical protein